MGNAPQVASSGLPEVAPVPAQAGQAGSQPQQAEASILIVDDEQLNLDMLSRRLRRSGFTVEVAASGLEAMEAVRGRHFDMVLLDEMMPGMSGQEVLRAWREQYSPDQLPVVMVTAVAESDKIAAALGAGANDYITKPVDFQVALARIRAQVARNRAGHELRRSEERYALAARASREGLWDWNLQSGEVYYSPRWLEMVGPAEAAGSAGLDGANATIETWLGRILPRDRARLQAQIDACLAVQAEAGRRGEGQHLDTLTSNYRLLRADGELRWMSCRATVSRDAEGRAVRLSGSQSDVTAEKTRDCVTGLPNRQFLLGQLELASGAEPPAQHAMLLLDLDQFKTINNSLGRSSGDELLKQIADRVRAAVAAAAGVEILGERLKPAVFSMGGDKFAVLIRHHAPDEAAGSFLNELRLSLKGAFTVAGRLLQCGFSVGAACGAPSGGGEQRSEAGGILAEADAALREAKTRGRGEVVFFEPGMSPQDTERWELESDLLRAVERHEFVVFYQAKAQMATGRVYGMEALVRWQHPTRGLLPPGLFIPAAEENGLIVEIGRWVLEQACRQVKIWHESMPSQPPLELSVNLSPKEFNQPNLVEQVQEILDKTSFPPSSLHLEITESVLIEELAEAREVLHALKGLGVHLELDDFGSGYSSLKYLRELPFDCLKIDRYFTQSLSSDKPSSVHLVQAIISMAESLGLKVIAEGVETKPHSTTLLELGCRLGQGYYFSRPIEQEKMYALLTAQAEAEAEKETEDSLAGVPELGLGMTAGLETGRG